MLIGCDRNKDTLTSRWYHQTVSQFNPLFNGEQALLKGEQTLASQNQDNYDEILEVFPIGDEDAAATVKPDMDRAIEKATKVIQQHSMMIRNNQKNQVIDDSYLLIGKARFYNREYLAALETFNYVIQEFDEKEIKDEAMLWAARTETAMGNYFGAKERFEKIYRSEDLSKQVKAETFACFAQLEIYQGNKTTAYQLLEQATDRVKDKQLKMRWLFIMGQLQSRMGNDYKASQLFAQVIKKGPPYELLFQAQLERARNYDVDLQDPRKVFKDLENMLKDDKNYDNRDQIYYVMAEIAERMGDEALMEDYLKQSVKNSTTNATQKALSYLKLAENNFSNRMYPVAAAYYDSSYTNLPSDHKKYEEVQRKKESLAGLVENLKVIEVQDSLLKLADMGEKERLRVIRDLVDREREEAEEAVRAEQRSRAIGDIPSGDGGLASLPGQTSGGQWYFYNPNLRSSGVTDFMNRFGGRKLEDNWRRKNKESTGDFGSGEDGSGDENISINEADGNVNLASIEGRDAKVEEYLKKVPGTEAAIAEANRKIAVAYMNIGNIYRNDLKDLEASEDQFKALLKRYPNLEEKGRVWYTLYRINTLMEDQKEADYYRDLILAQLSNSEYAALIRGEGLAEENANLEAINYYHKTYHHFKAEDYKKTITMADSGHQAFEKSKQAPQFLLLKAYAQAGLKDQVKMEQTLNLVVAQYSGTEQATQAQNILNHISGPENNDAAVASNKPKGNSKYQINEKEEHKYIAIVPNSRGLANNVTIDVIEFNRKFFKNINLNAKAVYLSPEEQMILVSGIPNRQQAMQYFQLIRQQNVLEKNLKPNEIKHFVISNSNFSQVYQEKDFSAYLTFFNDNYL